MQSHQRTAQRKRQTYKSCITNIKWKKPLKTYSHSSPFEKFLPIPLPPWHLSMSLYELAAGCTCRWNWKWETRLSLVFVASSERDAVDYFLITKAKLWWEHPLSHLLYIPLPVWHHSICQPWLKWRNFPQFQIQLELEDADEWGKTRPRRGGDVPKVLSMQMTGQTTCRYNGNNNSNNNNNNSNVVIFTGTHTHTYILTLGHRASLYVGVSCERFESER